MPKLLLFSVIISGFVAVVVGKDMFSTYESIKSGFFSITSAAIWVGVFNSIQEICKEHEMIRDDYRNGMRISAYVTAHVMWQFVICFLESCILLLVTYFFIDYNDQGILMNAAIIEYFITILLITFGADCMGIAISSIADSPTGAMTIMPFVLMLQMIMSGVLFTLEGWAEKVSNITFSKWGMNAFGAIADLNSDAFPLEISAIYPEVVRLDVEQCFERTASNLLSAWMWCLGLALFFYILSVVSLVVRNRSK